MKNDCSPHPQRAGWSLIELLVTMGIMIVMMSLVTGVYRSFAANMEVTNAVSQVSNVLTMARHLAVSRNEYTQVRLLSPSSGSDLRAGDFVAVGIYRADSPIYAADYTPFISSGRFRQEGAFVRLPLSCVIPDDSTYSGLADLIRSSSTPTAPRTGTTKMPDGSMYDWIAFYFKPDGSLDVGASGELNLSLCPWAGYRSLGTLPPNYAVFTFDRVNGRFQIVRP